MKQWIPAAGLVGTAAYAMYMVVQLGAQEPKTPVTGDFSNAAVAEVRNAQGQALLRGQFAPVDEEDDDIERKATLTAAGADTDAAGEAEVEVTKATPAEQEIEFSVKNLDAGQTVTFVIDNRVVGTVVVDKKGKAELEVTVTPGVAR